MLDALITALEAKGRLPHQSSQHDPESNLDHYNVEDFYLKQKPDGWVPCIRYKSDPTDEQNSIAIPDGSPFPTRKQAFLAGAEFVCEFLTGSDRLPFFIVHDQLMVAGYGTGGFTGLFMMSRPGPWI